MVHKLSTWSLDKLPSLPILRTLMVTPARLASTQILDTIFMGLCNQGAINYQAIYENESSSAELHDGIKWADIVFFFRSFKPNILSLLRIAKEAGKGVIYCIDDDFLQLDKKSLLGQIHESEENSLAFHAMFREADLVWVFTDEMIKRYRPLNSKIILGSLPSPFELFPVSLLDLEANEKKWTIGYAGGSTHQKDFEVAVKPLVKLLGKYSSRLKIEFMNYIPKEFIGHPNVKYVPFFENLTEYYAYMSKAKWAVGMAFMEDTLFNGGKTNNKYREYAAFGIPGIYSDVPVYSSCIKHGLNGYLTPHLEEAVYQGIFRLITDTELRKGIRKAALQDVISSYSVRAAQQQMLYYISLLAIKKIKIAIEKPKLLIVGYERVFTTHIDALQPCRELERRNYIEFTWKEPGNVTEEDVGGADFIYLVRAFEIITHCVFRWAQKTQTPLICSWDDNFFLMPEDKPLGQHLSKIEVRQINKAFLSNCSLIMTTTPPLAGFSRSMNCHVMEAIYGLKPPVENEGKRGFEPKKVRIGYFGVNEGINAPFVVNAIRKLRGRYKDQIIIETIGSKPNKELCREIDNQFEKILDLQDALKILKDREWDIGLAPLDDTDFNAAKQATKFRDYAWCGAAIVASDVPTYRRTITHGINGLLTENTPSAWFSAIESLIYDREKRNFLANGAKGIFENVHLMDKTIAFWYQLLWRMIKFKVDGSIGNALPHPSAILGKETGENASLISSSRIYYDNKIRYRIVPRHANWTGVEISWKIPQKIANGEIYLRIFSESNQLLRTTSVDASFAGEYQRMAFRFPSIANSGSIPFSLEFKTLNQEYMKFFTLLNVNLKEENLPFHLSKLLFSKRILKCRIIYILED